MGKLRNGKIVVKERIGTTFTCYSCEGRNEEK
jgi:hypothetical protein